jgi:LysR family glycine cleavage system transcriptional activator
MTESGHANPSLDLLRGFEAAARHLNFTRAADELFITQSAVSRQIKTLEDRLGVALFVRQAKGLRLTEAGAQLYHAVSSALRQVNEAMEGLSRRTRSSLVTVTSTLGFCALWLIPRLGQFNKLFPEVEVRIAASDRILNLDRERIDLSIRYSPLHSAPKTAAWLFDEQLMPVCSPALLAAPERPLSELKDLRHHTLLHLEWTPTECKWPDWQAWLMAAGASDVDHTRGPRFTWHAMALQAAVQGQGVALASTPIVNDDLAAGRLVCPFDRSISTRFGYYLVCLPELAATRKIQAFREWLLREAEISVGERGLAGDPGAEAAPPARAANLA